MTKVVCYMDALGTRSVKDIENYLKKYIKIIKIVNNKKSKNNIKRYFFQDSIILIGKCDYDSIKEMILMILYIVSSAMEDGILFRGSVSYGKIKISKNVPFVLGDAIKESVEWADLSHSPGIFITPISMHNNNMKNFVKKEARLFVNKKTYLKNLGQMDLKFITVRPSFYTLDKLEEKYKKKIQENFIKPNIYIKYKELLDIIELSKNKID